MDNPQAPTAAKFRVKFYDGPAAGSTREYDRESETVRCGPWTYEHTHRREGDYWLFVRRLNPRNARRVVKAIVRMNGGKDPRLQEKQQPNKVLRRGRNAPCWCGSGKKYKKCHASPEPAA